MPEATLRIERAANFLARLAGLLARAPLRVGEGLLIERCRSVHTCFMRYAIDVVFLDGEGLVLRVCTLAPWRAAACARAWAVLELRAGEASRLGLAVGVRLRMERGS